MNTSYISRLAAGFALAVTLLMAAAPPAAGCTGGVDDNSVTGTWSPSQGSCTSLPYEVRSTVNFNFVDSTPKNMTVSGLYSDQACLSDGTVCPQVHLS